MRRKPRTSGAINRLSMNARVIGTSTSRAKYSNANNVAVDMIPNALSRIGALGGTVVSAGAMPHFGTEPGSSAALTATKTQHLTLSANDARFDPDHQEPPLGRG